MSSHTKHLAILFFLVVFGNTTLFGQEIEKNLRTGVLDNGLHYYILQSKQQKGLVSFYLNQKVGSMVEEDNQKGLAHFLEHMAFNGSQHFPDGVMNYLKSRGVSTVNAHTGMNETVYYVENVRARNAALVDTCIYLLRDWCGSLLLNDDDINKERKIITEEWRKRNDAKKRQYNATAPYAFNFSKYAERSPIGDIDIIQNFQPDSLRSFYKKWYISDNQGVIIVGDINPDEMEQKVIRIFSDLKKAQNHTREEYKIATNAEPLYYEYINDEVTQNKITIQARREEEANDSTNDVRKNNQFRQFFNGLAKQRITRYMNSADTLSFVSASITNSRLVSNYYVTNISVVPYFHKDKEALTQIYTLFERIYRYGFSEDEVAELKTILLEQLHQKKKNLSDFKNGAYVKILQNNFNRDSKIVSIQEDLDLNIEIINSITSRKLNQWIQAIDINKNQFIGLSESKPHAIQLNKNDIINCIKTIQAAPLSPSATRSASHHTLMENIALSPQTITYTQENDTFKNAVWHLSNGIRVIYKYTDKDKGKFQLSSLSKGGRSLIAPSDLPTSTLIPNLLTQFSVNQLSKNQLQKIITENQMAFNINLGSIQEGITCATLSKNSEILFQLLYTLLTHPQLDQKNFDNYVRKIDFKVKNENTTPLKQVQDSIITLTTIPNNRTWFYNESFVKALNFDILKRLFHERFQNNEDFTYYIIGDIDKDEAKKLACLYLANLPTDSAAHKEQFINYNFESPQRKIEKIYPIEMPGNKAIVQIKYLNNKAFTSREKMSFNMLSYTLERRYFNSIRQEAGGTYGVKVKSVYSEYPQSKETLNILFETERGKEKPLKDMIYSGIKTIQSHPITESEFQEALAVQRRNEAFKNSKQGIDYWSLILSTYYEQNTNLTAPNRFKDEVDKVTINDVKKVARKFFSSAKLLGIVIVSTPK